MGAEPGLHLVAGLGNPGPRYQDNRHNVGYWLVDTLARERGAAWRSESRFLGATASLPRQGADLRLLKPTTFMNRSGAAVAAVLRYFRLPAESLLVVHDDLDLPPGAIRLKRGGGHGGHNGLRDVIAALGTADFWRLRIGIGHPGHKSEVVDYVLQRPTGLEQREIDAAMDLALQQWPSLAAGRYAQVMNVLHARQPAGPGAAGTP